MFVRICAALAALSPIVAAGQINGYAEVTAISGTTCTIGTSNETYASFTTGKSVVLMQVQDDVIGSNTTNASTFGDLGNIRQAGQYRIREIVSVTRSAGVLTSVTLSGSADLPFNIGPNASVQLITYELLGGGGHYTTTANISAVPWNGSIGGVVALHVGGSLTLQHNITADGAGFRGGARATAGGGSCNTTTFIFAATGTNSQYQAGKGEGIYKRTDANWANARGKILNGGGGANSHNGGGGGGGNYTAGGLGGHGYGCAAVPAGGLGGIALSASSGGTRAFMGGGGGGGEGNNAVSTAGANGGGIILIKAGALRTTGTCGVAISADGNSSSNTGGNDGSGGAGAGGTIVLDVIGYNVAAGCPLTVRANGGNGGTVQDPNAHGGGGGGGQGAIVLTGATPAANITMQTNNGIGGCNNNAVPCVNQAGSGTGTSGTGVFTSTQTPLPIELAEFTAKPDGDAVELSWTTASETDNATFTVERSADATAWTTVLTQPGAGHSHGMRTYTGRDTDPLLGTSFYRLKQTDFDGNYTHSGVVSVSRSARAGELFIHPHPATDHVTVQFDPALGNGHVLLLNSLGQHVARPVATEEGRAELDVSGVPSGAYVIVVSAGGTAQHERLLVRH